MWILWKKKKKKNTFTFKRKFVFGNFGFFGEQHYLCINCWFAYDNKFKATIFHLGNVSIKCIVFPVIFQRFSVLCVILCEKDEKIPTYGSSDDQFCIIFFCVLHFWGIYLKVIYLKSVHAVRFYVRDEKFQSTGIFFVFLFSAYVLKLNICVFIAKWPG